MSDPYFDNVTLLLHCDGSDGSTTFTDVKGHTVTPSGNAQIDTAQSKFGGASALFDGTDDYLSIGSGLADFGYGTGDFTIEFWCRLNAQVSHRFYVTSSDTLLGIYSTSTGFQFTIAGSSGGVFGAASSTGVWLHVAMVRYGGVCSVYVDGVKGSTNNTRTTSIGTPTFVSIGGHSNVTDFNGHLDEVRITKGVARYTADFTPPTAAFADAAPTTYDPFFDNVTLLLHCDGTDGSTTFTDVKGHTVTPAGNAQLDTAQSKFGGAAALFDGSNDWISTTDNLTDFEFGSGDFCVEFWCRLNVSSSTSVILSNSNKFLCQYTSSTGFKFFLGGTERAAFGTTSTTGTFHHVALVRYSGVCSVYVDGIKGSSNTTYTTAVTGLTYLAFGGYTSQTSLNGSLDDIRITKGVARYVTNFTPTTAAFPDTKTEPSGSTTYTITASAGAELISAGALTLSAGAVLHIPQDRYFDQVKLLWDCEESGALEGTFDCIDLIGRRIYGGITGSAGTSSFGIFRYGTASIECQDAYRRVPLDSEFTFSGDLTIEGYFRYMHGGGTLFSTWDAGTWQANAWRLNITSDYKIALYIGNNTTPAIIGATDIESTLYQQWSHFALCRSGSTVRLFLNGALEGSCTNSATLDGSGDLYIGGLPPVNSSSTSSYSFPDQMDELRVTAAARYTSEFTAPSQPFPRTGDDTFYLTCSAGAWVDANAVNNTWVLMHFDGIDPITYMFSDERGRQVAMYAEPGADPSGVEPSLSIGQYKFGGGAVRFNGDNYVEVVADETYAGHFIGQIELWFKVDYRPTQSYYTLLSSISAEYGGNWSVMLVNQKIVVSSYWSDASLVDPVTDASAYITSDVSISDYEWHHLALLKVSSPNEMRMYVDGVLQSGRGVGLAYSSYGGHGLFVGNHSIPSTVGSTGFRGWIDELRVADISEYYDSFTPPTEAFPDGHTRLPLTAGAVLSGRRQQVTYAGASLQKAGYTRSALLDAALKKTLTKTPAADACLGMVYTRRAFAGPAALGMQKELQASSDFMLSGTEYALADSLVQQAKSRSASADAYASLVGLTRSCTAGAKFSSFKRFYANSAVQGTAVIAVGAGAAVQGTVEITLNGSINSVVVLGTSRTISGSSYLTRSFSLSPAADAYRAKQRLRTVTGNVYVGGFESVAALADSLISLAALRTLGAAATVQQNRRISAVPSAAVQSSSMKSLSVGAYLRTPPANTVAATTRIDGEWVALMRPTEWTLDVRNTEFAPDARNTEWVL